MISGGATALCFCGFRQRSRGVGFHDYINFSALLQAGFFAFIADEFIFNADLPVKIIGFGDGNLRLFRFAGVWLRFDNALNNTLHPSLLRHWITSPPANSGWPSNCILKKFRLVSLR